MWHKKHHPNLIVDYLYIYVFFLIMCKLQKGMLMW